MKSLIYAILMTVGVGFSGVVAAEEMPSMSAVVVSAEFARIAQLAGRWEGTSRGHGKTEMVAAEYKLTSGGSAVIETLFHGTDHEMVTVYYDEAGKPSLTHYCALGNRPHMAFKSADDGSLSFEMGESGGVDPATPHMHALTLETPDPDRLTQIWTFYENGAAKDTTRVDLSRVR